MAKRRRSSARSVGRLKELAQARRNELVGFSLLPVALLVLLSLVSYDQFDTGVYTSDPNPISHNVVGIVGAYIAEGLFFPFGLAAFVIPVALAWWAWRAFFGEAKHEFWIKLAGLGVLMISLSATAGVYDLDWGGGEFRAGGLVGYYLDSRAQTWFGPIGSRVLCVSMALIGLLLTTDLLLFALTRRLAEMTSTAGLGCWRVFRRHAPGAWSWTAHRIAAWRDGGRAFLQRRRDTHRAATLASARSAGSRPRGRPQIVGAGMGMLEQAWQEVAPPEAGATGGGAAREPRGEPAASGAEPIASTREEADAPQQPRRTDGLPQQLEFLAAPGSSRPDPAKAKRRRWARRRRGRFELPAIDIFEESTVSPAAPTQEQFERLAAKLEHALDTFGIEAEVLNVVRGPSITRFELRLAPGIKVSRVHALCDDLALAMEVTRVRIEAPIPGRAAIGIEIPNDHRDMVRLRDVLASKPFQQSQSALTLALGKDIAGVPVVIDLAAMPHLLIAGATGAGKTVCVNALIASLLYRCPPEDVRMLLIDPKMVELSQYNGIPNLLWPVVTDAKEAGKYLHWLVREMEKRYAMLAKARTRNIAAFNTLVEENVAKGLTGLDEDGEPDPHTPVDRLPYIVTVIDELADLMMVSAKEVEDAIARLAQLARAVGIHLILATQRPSVDVLTGVIKANFPARISFAVRSKIDSRTVLDSSGAERLVGRGDMLYLPAGHSRPVRVQGAMVSDEEIGALVTHLTGQGEPEYLDVDVELETPGQGPGGLDAVDDDMFPEAVKLVLTSGQASISMLQRRLRVGYARAARLVDMMELQGIVGPGEGSKPRELLVGLEFLERLDDPGYAMTYR